MDSFAWAYPSATSSHGPSSSTPGMSIDDPFKDHSASSTTATQGQAAGTTANSNPSSSSLDLSAFTFDDITGSNSSSTMSPSNPYMHPFANYFVGFPYSTWPVSPSNVPLSSYSTLNGATTVSSSSSGSGMPQQAQSSQAQQPASSASQSQSHGQGQQHQQQSPTLQHATASPMLIDSQTVNGGSGSSTSNSLAAHAFQPNSYSASNSQYYTLSANPYISPYYRQTSSHGSGNSGNSNQTPGQGTLSPQALHSSASSPPNSSYMFSPTTGMHPAMFYGVPQSQPGPTAVPVSASSSSSSTPSIVSTPSTVTTPQLQHPHPSQQQFQQQYQQFQLQQQQQQQQFQQQLQQQHQQQEAAAREAAARDKERERREKFEKSVRPLLQSNAFSGAGAVRDLVEKIEEFGVDKVDPALRLEILQKMRDGAPNHYFRAWSENPDAMEVTKEWLKKATVVKDGEALSKEVSETVMPLLHILDRLPLTLDILKTSKIGRIVRNLVKQSPSPAIKDMASNLERRWLELVQKAKASDSSGAANSGSTPNQSSGTEAGSKKRKEPPSASSASTSNSKGSAASGNGAPPSKKPAVGTSTSTKPSVKKESSSKLTSSSSSSAAASAKGAGTDTSFFSAPKKTKLPSFKKAPIPPPAAKPATPNADSGDDVALPSAADPFAEIVKAMKLKREPLSSSSPANVPGSAAAASGKVGGGGTASGGKPIGKRKSVTWASGDALVSVKLIERAVYDDDVKDGMHTSLRDLDRGEGAALHQQGLEEAIDWSEPQALLLTEDTDHPRGGKSEEKEVQEAREATALGALYMNASQIPDSPAEPSQVIPEEEVDKNAVIMTLGPDNEDLTWNAEMMMSDASSSAAAVSGQGPMAVDPLAALQAQPAVAQLLQQLGAIDPSVLSSLPLPAAAPGSAESFAGASAGPTLQSLIQQLQSTTPGYEQGQQQQPSSGGWQGPGGGGGGEYDQGDYPGSAGGPGGGWGDSSGGGRRGRGRGGRGPSGGRGGGARGSGGGGEGGGFRSNRRIPCTFFAEGRCKFGDHCNFAHVPGQPAY